MRVIEQKGNPAHVKGMPSSRRSLTMNARTDLGDLAATYDASIPPAELAAARWGAAAWTRLARGADAALIEARLRDYVAALGRLRRAEAASGAGVGALERLAGAVAHYRRASMAILAM